MRKKIPLIASILLLAAAVAVYFRPLPLADTLKDGRRLLVLLEEIRIENGEPVMEISQYNRLSQEQQDRIRALFEGSTYRRTFRTPLSDGSTSGLSEQMVYVHTFDEDTWAATVFFSESGELSANYRTYRLDDAPKLMKEIAEICEG